MDVAALASVDAAVGLLAGGASPPGSLAVQQEASDVGKATQVDLPECSLKRIMLLTIESIREELSRYQADRGGTKEQLALRLLELRKLSMVQ